MSKARFTLPARGPMAESKLVCALCGSAVRLSDPREVNHVEGAYRHAGPTYFMHDASAFCEKRHETVPVEGREDRRERMQRLAEADASPEGARVEEEIRRIDRQWDPDAIHVDTEGRPFPRPCRYDYPHTFDGVIDYQRAVWAYKARLAAYHWDLGGVFCTAFGAAIRETKRPPNRAATARKAAQ